MAGAPILSWMMTSSVKEKKKQVYEVRRVQTLGQVPTNLVLTKDLVTNTSMIQSSFFPFLATLSVKSGPKTFFLPNFWDPLAAGGPQKPHPSSRRKPSKSTARPARRATPPRRGPRAGRCSRRCRGPKRFRCGVVLAACFF